MINVAQPKSKRGGAIARAQDSADQALKLQEQNFVRGQSCKNASLSKTDERLLLDPAEPHTDGGHKFSKQERVTFTQFSEPNTQCSIFLVEYGRRNIKFTSDGTNELSR